LPGLFFWFVEFCEVEEEPANYEFAGSKIWELKLGKRKDYSRAILSMDVVVDKLASVVVAQLV
jgi:hypothetical protein